MKLEMEGGEYAERSEEPRGRHRDGEYAPDSRLQTSLEDPKKRRIQTYANVCGGLEDRVKLEKKSRNMRIYQAGALTSHSRAG